MDKKNENIFVKFIKKDFCIYLFFLLFVTSIYIVRPISNLDELWNYNFARQISEGLIPYRDISIIVTPFASFVSSIFLNISDELIIMRILGIILSTSTFYMMYIILKNLTNKKIYSLIFSLITLIGTSEVLAYDYNNLAVLEVLIILYIEIVKNKKDIHILQNNIDFLIGILTGIIILTKQTVGFTMSIAVIILPLIDICKKSDIKIILKIILKRIIGIIIPCIIFLIYLLITNSFYDFMSYAVFGVGTFNNKVSYSRLFEMDLYTKIIAILVPISILMLLIVIFKNFSKDKKNEDLIAILLYGIAVMIISIPIFDKIHFLISSLVLIIAFTYLVNIFLEFLFLKINDSIKIFIIAFVKTVSVMLLMLIYISIILVNLYNYFTNKQKDISLLHYKGIEVSEGLSEKISQVDTFILEQKKEGKEIYILDAEAVVYNIPLDIYNKNYDMFLIGNFGKDGIDGIMKDIIQKREQGNSVFLIRNPKYSYNWQTPMDIIKYIQNNFEKVGEVSIFEVYE